MLRFTVVATMEADGQMMMGIVKIHGTRCWQSDPQLRFDSPFTNEVIQDARQLDADHIVPLSWSWQRGADKWSDQKREKFANDPSNVLIVESSLNRSLVE